MNEINQMKLVYLDKKTGFVIGIKFEIMSCIVV